MADIPIPVGAVLCDTLCTHRRDVIRDEARFHALWVNAAILVSASQRIRATDEFIVRSKIAHDFPIYCSTTDAWWWRGWRRRRCGPCPCTFQTIFVLLVQTEISNTI